MVTATRKVVGQAVPRQEGPDKVTGHTKYAADIVLLEKDLSILADGVVEGLESADGLVLAVQCHPEELTAHAWARDLFRCFVATAAGRRAVGAGAGR